MVEVYQTTFLATRLNVMNSDRMKWSFEKHEGGNLKGKSSSDGLQILYDSRQIQELKTSRRTRTQRKSM